MSDDRIITTEPLPAEVLARLQQHSLGIDPGTDYPRDEHGNVVGTLMTPDQMERYIREQQSKEAPDQVPHAQAATQPGPARLDHVRAQAHADPLPHRAQRLLIQLIDEDGNVTILANHRL